MPSGRMTLSRVAGSKEGDAGSGFFFIRLRRLREREREREKESARARERERESERATDCGVAIAFPPLVLQAVLQAPRRSG
jgi:hypothetical protein